MSTLQTTNETEVHFTVKTLVGSYAGNGIHKPKGNATFDPDEDELPFGDIGEKVELDVQVKIVAPLPKSKNEKPSPQEIAKNLFEKYPLIAIDSEVIGEPRLANTRFAVSNVLTAFTIYNSVEEIIDEYEGRYTEKQLKDAVKFARDFLDSFYAS